LSSADPALTAPWDPLAAQTSSDFGAVFNELAYQPLRTAEQEWMSRRRVDAQCVHRR
jgi:hypothetical protein